MRQAFLRSTANNPIWRVPEAELFLLFIRPLNRAGIRYVIGGSVAAIFYGEPRLTVNNRIAAGLAWFTHLPPFDSPR
jgi:hypothetical protein